MRRKCSARQTLTTLVLLTLLVAPNAFAAGLSADPQVQSFIQDMHQRHNFDSAELTRLMDEARVLDSILKAISRPAEAKPWYQYRRIFLNPDRIDGGVDFWNQHADTLARAESQYGVPAEIIVAIIGVETLYGTRKGKLRVLDALVTLGFRYPKRSDFFRRELEHYLLLTREEGLDPTVLTGSYAGAMGIPQFISSSYRAYAVDFDGDAVRDLLQSTQDAIGSVAAYLAEHGWQRGEAVAAPAKVTGNSYHSLIDAGIKPNTSVGDMHDKQVDVYGALPGTALAALMEFELEDGVEHWVGLKNFYMITRYNHSKLYALAVYQLSEAIKQQRSAG